MTKQNLLLIHCDWSTEGEFKPEKPGLDINSINLKCVGRVDPVLVLHDRVGQPPATHPVGSDEFAPAVGDHRGQSVHRGLLVVLGEVRNGDEESFVGLQLAPPHGVTASGRARGKGCGDPQC